MECNLNGKVALVTGATSGLGKRFATVLADAGASVAVMGRRAERLEALKADIEGRGGRCAAIAADVTDDAALAPALAKVEEALGPLDILVNNAGMNVRGFALDLKTEDFDRIIGTNLRAPFMLAREAARRMIAAKRSGKIINVASIGAFRALPGLATYCISKAAVAMMTQCLAREWASYDIAVNAICPGYIETELNSAWFESEGGQKQVKSFPKKRLMREEDLDGMLLLLSSDASRAINGALLTVDDLQSL